MTTIRSAALVLCMALVLCTAGTAQTLVPPSSSAPPISLAQLYYGKMNWAGEWSSAEVYKTQDVVTFGGNTWVSLAVDNIGNTPAAGIWWDLLSSASGGGGGGGGGASVSFTGAASVVFSGGDFASAALDVVCYDTTVSPATLVIPDTVRVDQATFAVTIAFANPQTGTCYALTGGGGGASGGSMTWPAAAGIAVYDGSEAWGPSLTAPSGAIVGTSDTQTLTNKTVDGVTPATLAFLDATSSIQTQINAKAPLVSPSFTTPSLGAATAASLLAGGIVDGTAPVTLTTGVSATLGGTYNSGYTLNQEASAATAVTYTLPTAAAGKQYCVGNGYNGSAANTGVLTLQTSASGQFIINTDGTLSASGGYMQSGGAGGDFACVVGIDATHWYFRPGQGTWTKH